MNYAAKRLKKPEIHVGVAKDALKTRERLLSKL
jgi:hypothetical protein